MTVAGRPPSIMPTASSITYGSACSTPVVVSVSTTRCTRFSKTVRRRTSMARKWGLQSRNLTQARSGFRNSPLFRFGSLPSGAAHRGAPPSSLVTYVRRTPMRAGLVAGELSAASSTDSAGPAHRARLATLHPEALKIEPDRAGGHKGELRSEAPHAAGRQFVPEGVMRVDLQCTRTPAAGARLWSALGLALVLAAVAAPPVAAQTACMNDADCNDNNPCTVDQCFKPPMGPRVCVHTPGNMGAVCRASAGMCDPAETCDGLNPTCPPDAKSVAVCRAAAGECDLAESCDGVSNDCPSDAKKASGTACTSDGNPCTLDQCNGTSNACQHPAGNAGTVCRASAGNCDVAETCTGSSTVCPADAFKPSGTICRDSAGQCDVAEACTGSSGACPADVLQPSTAHCTGASQGGTCDDDAAEHCTGTSATTCVDVFKSSSTVCRASAGQCDVAETCTGSSGACPIDAKSTAVCRASAGACDLPGSRA